MTTNQTIDGVSRLLLRDLLEPHSARCLKSAQDRLRALLDAPAVSLADEGEKPAALPQGEQVACMPVERCYDVRAKMIIAFNESKKAGGDLDDALDAAYKSALRYSPNPLSVQQPAPVAVAYQYRQRPLWRKDDNSGWMPWQDCSQEAHADYTASPDLHDWQYETRTLYVGPNQQ